MSNKRNRRRYGQRIRAEVSRKPRRVSKAVGAMIASQPAERARKAGFAWLKEIYAPTRKQIKARSRVRLRLKYLGRIRKPRTKYGRTFWNHSLDA